LAVVRRLLYNHNPFYVISALLVLCGVWRSVAGQEVLASGWTMLGVLCGYVALLAGAAWAIVRLGGVWQDARTLLVVIVVMLLALSMSFDPVAVLDSQTARRLLLCGLAFAVVLSEATMRGLGIRLSRFYRGPYYAALALLFLYPLWLGELIQREESTLRAWSLMLFPALAAVILLMLLPAARWGRTSKWASGAPWPWPLFPWTLFFFLALGFGVRSYSLAYAFESGPAGESGFRAVWLAPLVLACSVLTLEMGLAARSRLAQLVAGLTPLCVLPMALSGPGDNATQAKFLALLQDSLAGPAILAAGTLIAFYAWAWARQARLAEAGLMMALAMAALVDGNTVDWRTLDLRNPAPLGAIVVLQLILSVRHGASWRMLIVTVLTIAAASWPLRQTPLVHSGYAPLHLFLLTFLAVGLTFEDRFARGLRRAAPYLIPVLAMLAATAYPLLFPQIAMSLNAAYAVALAVFAGLYWRRERALENLAGALVTAGLVLLAVLRAGYVQLDDTPLAAGRDWVAAGLAFLGVGVFISLAKGGVLQNAWSRLAAWNRRFEPQPPF
jgi:hypothetical protein